MTFLPGIPLPGDKPSQSQGQLRNNFTALNTVFAEDHLAFNAVNGGKHQQSTYLTQAAPGNLAGEGTVYVGNSGGTREYAYYQRESSGVSIPFSMLGGFANSTGAGVVTGTAFNLTVVRTFVGSYTVTFTNPMVDANYIVSFSVQAAGTTVYSLTIRTKAANNFTFDCRRAGAFLTDPTSFSVIVMGEIA